MVKSQLPIIYKKLYAHFGPQHWWPGKTPFEVMVGAILTQNTNWQNVEKAIKNLRKNKLLNLNKLYQLPAPILAQLIRPAGYYNIKAKRLRNFLVFLVGYYKGNLKKMRSQDTSALRRGLLTVNGIGEETADSILLYALKREVFVVDSYTKRILLRHALIEENASYAEVQNLFRQNLKVSVKLFNEYHALIVKLGKEYCFKTNPLCKNCPLEGL